MQNIKYYFPLRYKFQNFSNYLPKKGAYKRFVQFEQCSVPCKKLQNFIVCFDTHMN